MYNKTNFLYYIPFFHDGSIEAVEHRDNKVDISLSSAEIPKDKNKYNIRLDQNNRMLGSLSIKEVCNIVVNDIKKKSKMTMDHDDASVLDFEIKGNKVELGVRWIDYKCRRGIDQYEFIEILADQILWKDALNDVTIDLTGLWTGTPPASTD